MEAFTTESSEQRMSLIQTLMDTSKDGLLRESFQKNNHSDTTREWFAWPNALFAELMQSSGGQCGISSSAKMPKTLPRSRIGPLMVLPEGTTFYTADTKDLRYRSIPSLNLASIPEIEMNNEM